jgi:crotonobetaine/carnitine-CoA ligase
MANTGRDMVRTLDSIIAAPERGLTLWPWLESAARGRGLFHVAGVELSYGALADRAARLASGLSKAGAQPGSRVAAIMADRIEIAELLFACARIGAVFAPINPYLKGSFLAYQLSEIEPAVLVVDAEGFAARAGLSGAGPAPNTMFHVGDLEQAGGVAQPLATAYREPDEAEVVSEGGAPTLLLYTSGTTGAPKGCLLSQAYLLKVGAVMADHWRMTPEDKVVTAFPLFHGAGLVGTIMSSLVAGASYRMVGAFHASRFMAEAAETGATIAIGPAAVGHALLAQPPRNSDRANRLRLACWTPFSPAAQRAFAERFGPDVWVENYGQTECMLITMSRLGGPRRPDSCGRPSPLVEVAILDDDGRSVPPGSSGEIAIRPATPGAIFQGYWRKPEATLAAWRNLWHLTGDYGVLDADGFLHFLDRKKDAIRRRGENVSCAELEDAILAYPKIRSAAVHAIPSSMGEDDIKACLILGDDQTATPEELFDFFRSNLPYFAIPRYVEVMTAFPMTGSMKVRKEALRERGTGSAWDFDALGLRVAREERRSGSTSPPLRESNSRPPDG